MTAIIAVSSYYKREIDAKKSIQDAISAYFNPYLASLRGAKQPAITSAESIGSSEKSFKAELLLKLACSLTNIAVVSCRIASATARLTLRLEKSFKRFNKGKDVILNSMVNGVQQSAETPTTGNGAITAGKNASSHNASETGPRVLNSWKDVANYLGKGVRTVQRYESQFGLPIRRPAGKNRSSVIALADEIDAWLNHAPTKNTCGPRVLLVLAQNHTEKDSPERMLLEVSTVNFHRARTAEEVCALVSRFDGDSVVVECNPGDQIYTAILDSTRQRHPATVIFVSPEADLDQKTSKSGETELGNVDAAKFLRTAKKALQRAKAA